MPNDNHIFGVACAMFGVLLQIQLKLNTKYKGRSCEMWMKPVLGWVGGWYHIHRQYKYTWYFALLKRTEYAHVIVGNLICITLSLLDVWTPNRKIGLSFTVLLFNSFEFLAGDGLIIGNDTSSILNVGSCGWIWICLPVCLPDSTSHRCNIKFSRKLKCNRLWKSTHTHTHKANEHLIPCCVVCLCHTFI